MRAEKRRAPCKPCRVCSLWCHPKSRGPSQILFFFLRKKKKEILPDRPTPFLSKNLAKGAKGARRRWMPGAPPPAPSTAGAHVHSSAPPPSPLPISRQRPTRPRAAAGAQAARCDGGAARLAQMAWRSSSHTGPTAWAGRGRVKDGRSVSGEVDSSASGRALWVWGSRELLCSRGARLRTKSSHAIPATLAR